MMDGFVLSLQKRAEFRKQNDQTTGVTKRLTDAQLRAVKAEQLALSLSRDDGSLSSDSTDEDVFTWLNDHHNDERVRPFLPESLPAFKRSLGRARKELGTRKRLRAAPSGKSVVRKEDVEPVSRKDN
jgi:hypothetical protein